MIFCISIKFVPNYFYDLKILSLKVNQFGIYYNIFQNPNIGSLMDMDPTTIIMHSQRISQTKSVCRE